LKQNQRLRREGPSFTPFSTHEESGEQKFPCHISQNENVKMVSNSFLFKALHSDGSGTSKRTQTSPSTTKKNY